MTERDPQPEREPEEKEPFVPASFEKRAAAWMGVAYMLMLLFVTTFAIFTGGRRLPGTFPLLLIPAAAGAAAIALHRQKLGTAPGGLPLTVLVTALCAAAVILGLALGGPALLEGVRHAYD